MVSAILSVVAAPAHAYEQRYSVGTLAAVQMQGVVSSPALHDRGEILYRPFVRLTLPRAGKVDFAFLTRSGTRLSGWSETLGAGSSFVLIDPSRFTGLGAGRYRLRVEAFGGTEEVAWAKTSRGGARSGSIGFDRMTGTARADRLAGQSGGDSISGRGGGDFLWGDTASDTVRGGPGDDMVDGGSAGDRLYGDSGDDIAYGGYGRDELYGGSGDDSLDGAFAPDTIHGGGGNDVIHGGGATDRLDGGPGDDRIFPDSSADVVKAGEGDDTVFYNSGKGSGSVDCGPGQDTLLVNRRGEEGYYSSRRMLTSGRATGCEVVVWAPNEAGDPRDGVTLRPSPPGTTLLGTALNDRLLGNASSEDLIGSGGDDELWANCCLEGQGTTSVDWIEAGAGDDTVYGGFGTTVTDGGPGSDYIQGGAGRLNRIDAGPGDDFVRLVGGNRGRAFVQAGSGDDTVFAVTSRRGRVTVYCGPGRDRAYVLSTGAHVKGDCERVTRY